MEILKTSVHTIDYAAAITTQRNPPESFVDNVLAVFEHAKDNQSVQLFKERSLNTEVLSSIFTIVDSKQLTAFDENAQNIANRLLRQETVTQGSIERMNVSVKKGSLIQAILRDDADSFMYLIAKVQHSEFVDDADLADRTGFSKNQKSIWKTCLIHLDHKQKRILSIKIFSDTGAKYWVNAFLEVDPVHSDDENTKTAFKAIDIVVNRLFGNKKDDKMVFRNNVIATFRKGRMLNYRESVEDWISKINSDSIDADKIKKIKEQLLKLPEEKGFDWQFTPNPKKITGKIRKNYPISPGIELRVDQADDLYERVEAFTDSNGKKFLKLSLEDEQTYKEFLRPPAE
ncbi:MAG: nucleoid-associated protein [bacterium]|nr:nucleoid-associated protein [bacterium]